MVLMGKRHPGTINLCFYCLLQAFKRTAWWNTFEMNIKNLGFQVKGIGLKTVVYRF